MHPRALTVPVKLCVKERLEPLWEILREDAPGTYVTLHSFRGDAGYAWRMFEKVTKDYPGVRIRLWTEKIF